MSDEPKGNDRTIMPEIDLSYRPASYWPADDRPDEPVQIAVFDVNSHHGDYNYVTAEPADGGRIRFRLVHEEGGELGSVSPEIADAPLTLGELIALIDTADVGDAGPGFVYALLDMNELVGSGNPSDAGFVTVSSEVYETLGVHYDRQISAWVMGEDSA